MSLSVDLQFSLLQFVGHAEKAFPWCNARVCGAIGVVTSLPQIDDLIELLRRRDQISFSLS